MTPNSSDLFSLNHLSRSFKNARGYKIIFRFIRIGILPLRLADGLVVLMVRLVFIGVFKFILVADFIVVRSSMALYRSFRVLSCIFVIPAGAHMK